MGISFLRFSLDNTADEVGFPYGPRVARECRMRISLTLTLVGLALGLSGGCGSKALSTADGGACTSAPVGFQPCSVPGSYCTGPTACRSCNAALGLWTIAPAWDCACTPATINGSMSLRWECPSEPVCAVGPGTRFADSQCTVSASVSDAGTETGGAPGTGGGQGGQAGAVAQGGQNGAAGTGGHAAGGAGGGASGGSSGGQAGGSGPGGGAGGAERLIAIRTPTAPGAPLAVGQKRLAEARDRIRCRRGLSLATRNVSFSGRAAA